MEDEIMEVENQIEETEVNDIEDDAGETSLVDPSTGSETIALAMLGLAAVAGGAIAIGTQKLAKPAARRVKGWWRNRKAKKTGVVDVDPTPVEDGGDEAESADASGDGK